MVVGGTGLVFVAGTPLFAFFGRLFDRAFWPRTPDTATRQFEDHELLVSSQPRYQAAYLVGG